MIDIEIIKKSIQDFADEYNFIQQIDIEMIEQIQDFNVYIKYCNKIHDKKYIILKQQICIIGW